MSESASEQALRRYADRHPITGRFLAFDCEVDCQTACWGACGAAPFTESGFVGDRFLAVGAEVHHVGRQVIHQPRRQGPGPAAPGT